MQHATRMRPPLACLLFLTTNIAAAQQQPGHLSVEPHTFESSQKIRVDAELGRLLVPENRRNPNSRPIELAFVRFKSTSPNPGSPIVYLAGGPGNSGIQQARGTRFPLFMGMREIADVIALDQRGTGMSKPNLECRERLDFPLDQPATSEAMLRLYLQQSKACAQNWQAQGIDLFGYNTNESADDLDDLRKALGAPKISLWGISYGTHLGLTAIRRHGQNIDRAILAGIEGPDHTQKLPSNYREHLSLLDKLVRADPGASKEVHDFQRLVHTLVAKLNKEPASVEAIDPQTKQKVNVVVSGFLFRYLLDNLYGTDATAYLPYIVSAASKGDFSTITYLVYQLRSSVGSAMGFMMDCSSGVSSERRRRVQSESRDPLFGEINFPFMEVCTAWGNPDLGAEFHAPIHSDVPVLFIAGSLDAKTPISNAKEIRRGFPRSSLLTIEGAVHSDPLFLSSPKIQEVMEEFIKGEPVSTTRIELPPTKFIMSSPLK